MTFCKKAYPLESAGHQKSRKITTGGQTMILFVPKCSYRPAEWDTSSLSHDSQTALDCCTTWPSTNKKSTKKHAVLFTSSGLMITSRSLCPRRTFSLHQIPSFVFLFSSLQSECCGVLTIAAPSSLSWGDCSCTGESGAQHGTHGGGEPTHSVLDQNVIH